MQKKLIYVANNMLISVIDNVGFSPLYAKTGKQHVPCSAVRHPRCVLYNSKELSVVIHTVKQNYIVVFDCTY